LDNFLDIYELSLNKRGEELCGDQVKILKTEAKTIIVLSDGLGSGVKANILATLTAEIIITMLKANASLKDVMETVIGTLPICKVRKIAYATFTIIEIDQATGNFEVINFDNPPIFYFKQGRLFDIEKRTEKILDKQISISKGTLERGDFLGMVSDGVLYAGLGVVLNFGWGWQNIAKYIENIFARQPMTTARKMVHSVIAETHTLYKANVGDDATFVGLYVREKNSVIVFTGPPLETTSDGACVEKVFDFKGRKVVCGGTTANIVARHLGEPLELDISTVRRDVPPIGSLDGIDLLTEGILTISKTLEYLHDCKGNVNALPDDENGAVLLTRELLRADAIFFLVGQKINEFYQNPRLPQSISIRKNLIRELAELLGKLKKEIKIEYC